MTGLAEIFGVLADPTRLKICMFLSQDELCVCDLAAMLDFGIRGISPTPTAEVPAFGQVPEGWQDGILHP